MTEISLYEHGAKITNCKEVGICKMAGTRSCPMERGLTVRSPLPLGRNSVHRLKEKGMAKTFLMAALEAGLVREDVYASTPITFPTDMLLGITNGQYRCNIFRSKRAPIDIEPVQIE